MTHCKFSLNLYLHTARDMSNQHTYNNHARFLTNKIQFIPLGRPYLMYNSPNV